MNYLAHGFRFLDEPYVVAGTSLPDWLNVADRRTRCRKRHATAFLGDPDPHLDAIARGVIRHHEEDDWFHQTDAFAELSLRFAVALREHCPSENSVRTGFVGHILVELLLDAALCVRFPGVLGAFYETVGQLDPNRVTAAVEAMTGRAVPQLSLWIPRFVEERFLADYQSDDRLLIRINQVMRRVGLNVLPREVLPVFAAARGAVADRLEEWLADLGGPGAGLRRIE